MTDHLKKCIAVAEDLKLTPSEFTVFEAIWGEATRRLTGAPVAADHVMRYADRVQSLAGLLAQRRRDAYYAPAAVPPNPVGVGPMPVFAPGPGLPGGPAFMPPDVRAVAQAKEKGLPEQQAPAPFIGRDGNGEWIATEAPRATPEHFD